jgi:hypothetical protein
MTHAQPAQNYGYAAEDRAAVDEGLQRRRYGGFHFGAALYGWLVSTGIGAILVTVLAAAGGAVAVTSMSSQQILNSPSIATIGWVSGIVFLAILAIGYYAGGYVAGRLSRFDGARQGLGVWLISIAIMILLALAGVALGAKYNILQQMNLPHIPVQQGSFTTGGIIASAAALVVSLLAALAGGKTGERYHRKVDAAGIVHHRAAM